MAIPAIGRKSQAPNPAYNVENFNYDDQTDTYTYPQGNTLSSNGSWYKARNYRFKQYKTKACKNCPVRALCTTAQQNGKIIQRSEYTSHIEENAARVAADPDTYKKRQALVEHPFGTMKRQWGFDHIMTKRGMAAASADVGLIALAYNLRRLFNITSQGAKELLTLFLRPIPAWMELRRMQQGSLKGFYREASFFGKTLSISKYGSRLRPYNN